MGILVCYYYLGNCDAQTSTQERLSTRIGGGARQFSEAATALYNNVKDRLTGQPVASNARAVELAGATTRNSATGVLTSPTTNSTQQRRLLSNSP